MVSCSFRTANRSLKHESRNRPANIPREGPPGPERCPAPGQPVIRPASLVSRHQRCFVKWIHGYSVFAFPSRFKPLRFRAELRVRRFTPNPPEIPAPTQSKA